MGVMRRLVLAVLGAAALACAPAPSRAQPVNGFYVGGGLGAAFLHNGHMALHDGSDAAPVPGDPPEGGVGMAGHGSFGYGLGNGMRFELEGSGARVNLPKGP
jgi:hypothetical protein